MQSEIGDPVVTRGLRCFRNPRWIRGNARDAKIGEHRFDLAREPCGMSWFEHYDTLETVSKVSKKRHNNGGIEIETGRQLNQYGTTLVAQPRCLGKKAIHEGH